MGKGPLRLPHAWGRVGKSVCLESFVVLIRLSGIKPVIEDNSCGNAELGPVKERGCAQCFGDKRARGQHVSTS